MRPSLLPKSQPKIAKIFALPSNKLPGQKSLYFGWDFGRNYDLIRPVVPGCAGCAMAHPDFGRSVNPISARGDNTANPFPVQITGISLCSNSTL